MNKNLSYTFSALSFNALTQIWGGSVTVKQQLTADEANYRTDQISFSIALPIDSTQDAIVEAAMAEAGIPQVEQTE